MFCFKQVSQQWRKSIYFQIHCCHSWVDDGDDGCDDDNDDDNDDDDDDDDDDNDVCLSEDNDNDDD